MVFRGRALLDRVDRFLASVGEFGIFAFKAIRESFRPPFEFSEIVHQLAEIGWKSGPVVIVCGFAFGIVLSLQTGSSMTRFGAQSMVPEAISLGLFLFVGPVITALLISGRVGAGIAAQLAGMRVTEQIDAMESLAVDSFKFLVVTRVVACVIALPILTLLLNYCGILGGLISEMVTYHVSVRMFFDTAFGAMSWSNYIPFTATTLFFGFIIGTVACFLGYRASQGAVGVGRASTRSAVVSSVLVILSEVILVKLILFIFP